MTGILLTANLVTQALITAGMPVEKANISRKYHISGDRPAKAPLMEFVDGSHVTTTAMNEVTMR